MEGVPAEDARREWSETAMRRPGMKPPQYTVVCPTRQFFGLPPAPALLLVKSRGRNGNAPDWNEATRVHGRVSDEATAGETRDGQGSGGRCARGHGLVRRHVACRSVIRSGERKRECKECRRRMPEGNGSKRQCAGLE